MVESKTKRGILSLATAGAKALPFSNTVLMSIIRDKLPSRSQRILYLVLLPGRDRGDGQPPTAAMPDFCGEVAPANFVWGNAFSTQKNPPEYANPSPFF